MPNANKVVGINGSVDAAAQGAMALFDSESGTCEWTVPLESPAGFCLNGDDVYVASMMGNRVMVLGPTMELKDSFSNYLMNDLHSLCIDGSEMLVTSSGTDSIIRCGLTGDVRSQWRATENGFCRTPGGSRRKIKKHVDFRCVTIETEAQTTHINSAVPVIDRGARNTVATLFHQGELLLIDDVTGRTRVLLRGMNCPHSIRRRSNGWMVCSSRDGSVVLLDREFGITDIVQEKFDWVQDAVELDSDHLLIADANNHRLVTWSVSELEIVGEIQYSSEWKVYQIEMLDETAPLVHYRPAVSPS